MAFSPRQTPYYLLRSYVILAATILIIALALDSVLAWLIPAESGAQAQVYAPTFALLNQRLADIEQENNANQQAAVVAEFASEQAALANTMGMPIDLINLDDFAGQAEFIAAVQRGDIVSLFDSQDREILYQRVPNSNYILALGPVPRVSTPNSSIERFVILSYYILVAIILFLWIRPFYRDLTSLRYAASRFGRDDFSTRVNVDVRSSIRPVAESFNKMAERIQYLVTAHQELTSAVSHELRTPLARLKFGMEMLGKIDDAAKKREYIAAMKTDVQELDELIDEMLNYAKLSEVNLQLNTTRLSIDTWLQQQLKQYANAPVVVQYRFLSDTQDDASNVDFNPDLMARALHNILRNSLRYATNIISVTCTITRETVSIRIADDGPGIPDDKKESVLEPFTRLDTSRDRQSGGYGLGLAISNRILQRHNGSITVEDSIPAGACFVLEWPCLVPGADTGTGTAI